MNVMEYNYNTSNQVKYLHYFSLQPAEASKLLLWRSGRKCKSWQVESGNNNQQKPGGDPRLSPPASELLWAPAAAVQSRQEDPEGRTERAATSRDRYRPSEQNLPCLMIRLTSLCW